LKLPDGAIARLNYIATTIFYARNVKKLSSFYDNSDRGQDFELLDSPAAEPSVHRQASLHDDGHHKVDWPYGILIQKDNMYAV
jgi:hypothetical protein